MSDAGSDEPTQRLPRREDPGIPSDAAADLAGDLLQPTVPGTGPGQTTPPTMPLPSSSAGPPDVPRTGAPRPVLGDRYELLEELGRGGMGVVYRAHDKTLGRDVALKVLQVAGRVDSETIERFQREARAAAALDHPNIVRVHDVGALPDGAPYYTMEVLAGQDLAHAITDGNIPPKQAVEAVRQVSLALLYAHQKGILHRDLKPQNIFLRRDPASDPKSDAPTMPAGTPSAPGEVHALLLDFGLAKLAERDLGAHAEGSQGRKSMQSLTRSGEIFGTPAYMPPEQTHGAKDVDARADIYSLGAALYHALAGRLMFDAASLAELLVKVQRQDPPPPSAFNADLDADLDTLTLKCLQKDPKDRYQNAGELAEDLKRWLAGDPISARPIGIAGRLWRKAKRNKAISLAIAVAAAAVIGTGAWFGGGAALRAWSLSRYERDYDTAMKAHDFEAAARAADNGRDLAPTDARWRERKDGALYEKAATVGRVELARWHTHRDEAARLAAAAALQPSASQGSPGVAGQEAPPSPEERDRRREERWKSERSLSGEALQREDAWSKASVAFTEALTHKVTDEAEKALTELYWDRYVRAEKDRDSAAMGAYESYVVQFGKEKYERELRGKRDVRVRFWLPTTYAGSEVTAYLSQYRPCDKPPVLVPVPYDLARGKPIQDRVESLTADQKEWKPVPLAATEGGGGSSSGPAPALPADEVTALELRASAAIATKHYADAVPVLDRLTRAVPSSSAHPYNLACCLAMTGDLEKALVAVEEAVRRGWKDADATEKDEDLAPLRNDVGFQTLLAVMRGAVPPRHVRVDSVVAGSQAETLGIRAGDVVTVVAGKAVSKVEDAPAAIQAVAEGDPYVVEVKRGTEPVKFSAKGGGKLGVQLGQVDMSPDSPTRFPWEGPASQETGPATPVAKARAGSLFEPREQEVNRVRLAVARDQQAGLASGGRPYLDFTAQLLRGSYLLSFPPGQGLYAMRYPFEVARATALNDGWNLLTH